MIPHPGTPAGKMLSAITSRSTAHVAIQRLQEALHRHNIRTSVAYDDGQQSRLHALNDLVVWADPDGQVFFWTFGPAQPGGRAERGPADQPEEVARLIADQLAEQAAMPVTAVL
ncbi:hypothetical protein ACFV1N_49080 [Streptosporangium canum]|uniref:hypothetical protein n=1 Tax=Streptosporangium canum TaxID=324952 RepID=UPI003693B39E